MRATAIASLVASLSFATVARADGTAIEKCTGNFEEAQLKEKRGKLIEAEQLYGACAETKCPAMVRADCSAKRDEMHRRIPTISVVVRDASGNDLTAYLEIDGHPVTDRAHAQPIDPGEHVVNYRAEGKKPATQKITVVEGEKARVISITAREGDEPAIPSSAPSKPSSEPTQATQPTQETQGGGSIVAPVVVGSIGVLALIAGVGVQFMAVAEDKKGEDLDAQARDDSTSEINRRELQAASSTRRDAAENDQTIAILLGAGGLVLIGTGVVLYLVTRPSPKKASFFTPVVTPGFAGASYGLRF